MEIVFSWKVKINAVLIWIFGTPLNTILVLTFEQFQYIICWYVQNTCKQCRLWSRACGGGGVVGSGGRVFLEPVLWLTLSGIYYACLEQISMASKMFEHLMFKCTLLLKKNVNEVTIITLSIETDSVDPDHMLQNAASDQGLHCLPLV